MQIPVLNHQRILPSMDAMSRYQVDALEIAPIGLEICICIFLIEDISGCSAEELSPFEAVLNFPCFSTPRNDCRKIEGVIANIRMLMGCPRSGHLDYKQ